MVLVIYGNRVLSQKHQSSMMEVKQVCFYMQPLVEDKGCTHIYVQCIESHYRHTVGWLHLGEHCIRPLTAKLRWCLFSSVPHVPDRLELHNVNWASGTQHPGPSESDVYSDVIQEAHLNDLLHTVYLSMHPDTPLRGNNARGAKYAVYYASIVTHTVFKNIKWLHSRCVRIKKAQSLPLLVYSLIAYCRLVA